MLSAHFSRIGGYGNQTPDLPHGRPEYVPLHHQPICLATMGCPDKRPGLPWTLAGGILQHLNKLLYISNCMIFELFISVLQNFIIHSYILAVSHGDILCCGICSLEILEICVKLITHHFIVLLCKTYFYISIYSFMFNITIPCSGKGY